MCKDGLLVEAHRAPARGPGKCGAQSKNLVVYKASNSQMPQLMVVVSGAILSRDTSKVLGGSGVRTITFPATVRTIRQDAFCRAKSLLSVVLNDGLEVLGTDEQSHSGVFQYSGLKRVRFPRTLKRLGRRTFMGCMRLRAGKFPDGLEHIGEACFSGTGLENVRFPASLRTLCQGSF